MGTTRLPLYVLLLALVVPISDAPRAGDETAARFDEDEHLFRLDPEERECFRGLRYLTNIHQQKQYLTRSTRAEREAWLERFWLILDPTPTTPRNERREMHEKRVEKASKLYSRKGGGGWDERGEALIRFGEPDSIRRIDPDVGFFGALPPREVWMYDRFGMRMTFEDITHNDRYTLARMTNCYDRWRRRLHREVRQGHIHSIVEPIDYTPTHEELIGTQIITHLDEDIEYDLFEDIEVNEGFYAFNNDHLYVHECDYGAGLLPVYFDVNVFGWDRGPRRVDVNIEVPANEIEFKRSGGLFHSWVELRVLARNTDMEDVGFDDEILHVRLPDETYGRSGTLLPEQLSLSLEPGYYRLGLEAIDRNSGRRCAYTTGLEVPPAGGGLGLSDLMFASAVRDAAEEIKFAKGDLQIVPHPARAYRIPYHLMIYFEIYGLDTDANGTAYYSVEYGIKPLDPRRSGPVLKEPGAEISSRFEGSGPGSFQPRRLEIATGELYEGRYLLTVEVTDRRTRRSVDKHERFSILE